ncbi:MAG: hypothetical protein E4H00_09055 [Myxococcales bacterium]|nr:MAG: hypothetical protein E4H00_09055 [Myxococcales bacterium]
MSTVTNIRSHLSVSTRQRAGGLRNPVVAAELRPVPPRDAAQAKTVLFESLGRNLTMQWCFAAGDHGFEKRLRAYVEVGHHWHAAQGNPIHGAYVGDELAGVAYLSLPEPEVAIDFEPFELDLLRACGEESMRRFGHYNRAVAATWPVGRLFSLALLGVRPAVQGRGVGTRLLHWVSGVCDDDPGSAGVITDTSGEAEVLFYAEREYRAIAQAAVNPSLVQTILFRPRRDRPS